jgi:hypothetical protein
MYQDPGHGWLRVPRSLLIELGIRDKITSYSYMKGNYVYLEEDQDLSTFIDAMEKVGKTVEYKESHTNKQSKIRQYDSYVNYSDEELEEMKEILQLVLNHTNWNKSSINKIKNASLIDLRSWKEHYNL